MSAIAGYTGQQATSIQPMLQTLKHWLPDREDSYSDAYITLGCIELYNSQESILTPQPLHYKNWVIIAHCRIDNRTQLAAGLGITNINSIADINYIALAYEKWGKACVHYLYGDFAFVVWDKTAKRLFGARDHAGIKTLYYSIINNELVFSNEIKGIKAYPFIETQINERYFIHECSSVYLPVEETPYSNVHLLPPGSYFEWQSGNLNVTKYWEFGKHYVDVPTTPKEQYEKFVELLYEAVRCRLRTSQKIAAEISGGLDSTGIAAIMMEILGKGSEVYSYCYGKADISAFEHDTKDDSELAREFCQRYGIEQYLRVVNENDYDSQVLIDLYDNVYDQYETNGVPSMTGAYLPYAREKQVNVVLSGWGGDQVVTNRTGSFKMQHAAKMQYTALWQDMKKSYKGAAIFPHFILEALRGPLRMLQLKKKSIEMNRNKMRECGLKSDYYKKYKIDSNSGKYYEMKNVGNRIDVYKEQFTFSGMQQRCFHHDLTGKHFNIEFRFPLLDVRLIEYVCSLPETTVFPGNKTRYLFTRAVEAFIPKEIIAIRKSHVPTTPFVKAFYQKHRTLFENEFRKRAVESGFQHYFNNMEATLSGTDTPKLLSLTAVYNKSVK